MLFIIGMLGTGRHEPQPQEMIAKISGRYDWCEKSIKQFGNWGTTFVRTGPVAAPQISSGIYQPLAYHPEPIYRS